MKSPQHENSAPDDDELPMQYYILFYYIPKWHISLYKNKLLLSDVNLNLVREGMIDFDLQPCINRCTFDGRQFNLRNDNLLDVPQLYRVFQVDDAYYAQVLDCIVKITIKTGIQENLNNAREYIQIMSVLRFIEDRIETPELTYARVAKLSDKSLLYTVNGVLYEYQIESQQSQKLQLKNGDEKKHDYMVFSYKSIVLVFDTLTNYICELKKCGDEYELKFLFETEGQELLFQNKYLIFNNGEQPKPLIEIIDIENRKLYTCHQNWYQDNFWSWLKVVRGEIEVDEEVETVVKKLSNGETVDIQLVDSDSE